MKFIVSSKDEFFTVYEIGDGKEQIFCAFFEDGRWWYRGSVKQEWRSFGFYSTDLLLLALSRVDCLDIDVKTFNELHREMIHFFSTNYPDMLVP